MNEVKRYDGKVGHSPDGGYVSHEDYAEEKRRADQNAQYLETLTGRMLDAEQERDALRQQLTATINSLTNAQEALKSAGIEADTVQAGVMELALMRDKMAAVARDFASTIAWADDVGVLSMTELKRYDLDGQCEEAISRAKLDVIDAADAYLNALRAEGVDSFIEKTPYVIPHRLRFELSNYAAQLRAGNAGKDGSHE